jgi:hypothetical protein
LSKYEFGITPSGFEDSDDYQKLSMEIAEMSEEEKVMTNCD